MFAVPYGMGVRGHLAQVCSMYSLCKTSIWSLLQLRPEDQKEIGSEGD